MKCASILYKNSEGTCLVYSTTTCRSPMGIGTASAIMPFLMTHSTLLPRLNLPQFRIFPPASPFSPYPIHFIPYSGLHRTTFASQQLWVRHPLWSAHVPPHWLWLWHHEIMWIYVNGVVQTVTWVNITGHIEVQTLKNFNCMWTRDLQILPLSATTCSIKYAHVMTVVSPSTSMVIVQGNHLIYTIFMIKIPQNVSCDFLLIFVIDLHCIITPHLTSREIFLNLFTSIVEICNKFAPSELNHCSNGQTASTFKYPIKALRDIGCHCPVTSSTIMWLGPFVQILTH